MEEGRADSELIVLVAASLGMVVGAILETELTAACESEVVEEVVALLDA